MNQNSDVVISVKDITKKFKVYMDKGHTLKERAISISRNKYEERAVLNGISFDVHRGEAVGLIGHNGCGKSTTLKLLTRIMYPDSGSIEIKGRVSSLLELGAGFHPDMSGRENIYINASIFGLSRKEIDEKIDDIIEFSELEEFIDNPVRTYSSGMYMRLAFSVAINVNAEILLIDEILAVGDVNFQAKCFNKMMEIKGQGTTIVLVSHSTSQIESICDRSIWIDKGKIKADGKPVDVHRLYLDYMVDQRNKIARKSTERTEREVLEVKQDNPEKASSIFEDLSENHVIGVKSSSVMNTSGEKQLIFRWNDDIVIDLELISTTPIANSHIDLNMVRSDGVFCCGFNTRHDGITLEEWSGEKHVHLVVKNVNLLPGGYHFDLHIAEGNGKTIALFSTVAEFEIFEQTSDAGVIMLEHSWNYTN